MAHAEKPLPFVIGPFCALSLYSHTHTHTHTHTHSRVHAPWSILRSLCLLCAAPPVHCLCIHTHTHTRTHTHTHTHTHTVTHTNTHIIHLLRAQGSHTTTQVL